MANIKLINRSGNNRTYTSDKGIIEVVLCLDPNLYVTTGYYLRTTVQVPESVLSKRFSSGKNAALAAYNAMI
jgi:hypothetical protein